jgi:hypothetical protein
MSSKLLLWFLAGLAFVSFFGGIIVAGSDTIGKETPVEMPAFLVLVVTMAGGALATNAGAVLGISFERGGAGSRFAPDLFRFRGWSGANDATKVQILAAYAYVIGLCAAAALWAVYNFKEDGATSVQLLAGLTKTLFGAAACALAVVLAGKS